MSSFHIHKVTAEDLMSGMLTTIIIKDDQVQIPLTDDRSAILRCTLRAPSINLVNDKYHVISHDSFMLYLNGCWKASMSEVRPYVHELYDTEDPKEVYARLLPWFYQCEADAVNHMIHRNEIEIFKAYVDTKLGGENNGGTR